MVRSLAGWACAALLAGAPASHAAPAKPNAQVELQSTALTEASGSAQRIYARAKPHLLQIRTLTAVSRSQAGVGSGFAIGDGSTVVTNYHVISRLALEPDRYVGEAVDTGGERYEFTIRAIDVRNDLAVLEVKRSGARGALAAAASALEQGQRLFSLGNPLDLGFAISEGRFNGVLKRPYYEHILFSGALNPGMSGGPALDDAGQVVGVNVARRLDGELISFLVPVHYVQSLIERAGAAPATELRKEIGRQLTDHQLMMAEHLQANPFTTRTLGPYRAPVNESKGVRCWGSSPAMADKPYRVDRLDCRMEFALFVEDILRVGYIHLRHEYIHAKGLDALRFSKLYSRSFKNEGFGSHRDKRMTGPQCTESFVRSGSGSRNGELQAPPLRAVLCVRALRKFDELYEFALLTATVDDGKAGLQSRIDVSGVTYETGLAITRAFLQAIGREPQ